MKRLVRQILLVSIMGIACPLTASGQINDPAIKPVNVARLESKRPLIEYSMAGAFIVAALAIGFKPSKRNPDAE